MMQPVTLTNRNELADIFRGFALFGVLGMTALWDMGYPPESTFTALDKQIRELSTIFLDSKSYTLLALLFGWGFGMLLQKKAGQQSIVPYYLRRSIGLIVLGLLHAVFLRNGDILAPYGLVALLLLLFRNSSDKTLFIAALIAYVLPAAETIVWERFQLPQVARPDTHGLSLVQHNLAFMKYWYTRFVYNHNTTFVLFVIGFYVARHKVASLRPFSSRQLTIAQAGLLSTGLLFYFISAYLWGLNPRFHQIEADAFYSLVPRTTFFIHSLCLDFFYMLCLYRLYHSPLRTRITALGYVGRMALSNYLLQSILQVSFFASFHLSEKVRPTYVLLLILAIWVVNILFSKWFLSRYRFGPFEWGLRSFTYGRWQPMQKEKEAPAPLVPAAT